MKKYPKIVYWIATVLICVMMLFSSYSYLMNPDMDKAFAHLGFPDFFRIELAIAKMIGALLLLIPTKGWIKEWVYAGFSFTFVSASLAHFMAGDPGAAWGAPLVFLAVLMLSYIMFKRLHDQNFSL